MLTLTTLTLSAPRVSLSAQRVKWPPLKGAPSGQPSILPPDSAMLPTYVAEGQLTPREWGVQLREVIDSHLAPDKEGTVLVRNLPTATAVEFAELMDACSGASWVKRAYEPFGGPRQVVDGVDLATNISEEMMLPPHNEMIYNPRPNDVVVLACNEAALSGGESLMARNADYTPLVSSELQDFLRERGGLRIIRRYADATAATTDAATPPAFTWQGRCGLDASSADRDAAEAAFLEKLGPDIEIKWDDIGTMKVSNHGRAFNADGDWCNILKVLAPLGSATAADGTPVPPELLEGLAEAEAEACRAVLLEAGDVWIMDNMRVAHGRLPFKNGEGRKRTVFTHLADNVLP